MLASLNHPNIAAIYGFEESNPSADSAQGAVQALVLELVGIEIEDPLETPRSGVSAAPEIDHRGVARAPAGPSRRERQWAAATAAMAVAIVVLAAFAFRRPTVGPRPLRLSIVPPVGTMFTPKDVSECGISRCPLMETGSRSWRRQARAASSGCDSSNLEPRSRCLVPKTPLDRSGRPTARVSVSMRVAN